MVFCTDGLFLSLSVFVILIGYFGLKQQVIFSNENILVSEDILKVQPKYSQSKLNDSEINQYSEKLVNYMELSKPYLNPDLALPQLAAELDISTHLLSQVINDHFEINFFDFVNGYRVNTFKERIADPKYANFSFLGIAFECRFNSKSAFNRVFKKHSGQTPSQYKSTVS